MATKLTAMETEEVGGEGGQPDSSLFAALMLCDLLMMVSKDSFSSFQPSSVTVSSLGAF